MHTDLRCEVAVTHEEAFLQAIIEQPYDDTPRLIYADWLEDHGDEARAEFIRVQCELSGMAVFNDHRRALQGRVLEILAAHGEEWLQREWPGAANTVVHARTFVRGFVAVLSMEGCNLRDRGVRALVNSPKMKLVTSLDLRENQIGDPGVRALAESPYVSELTFLDLGKNTFDAQSLRWLADSPYLVHLRELVVAGNLITSDLQYRFRGSPAITRHG
jgi:uncharacterized protein (TIGR02996 family)